MKNLILTILVFTFLFSKCTTGPVQKYDVCIFGGTSAGIIAGHAAEKLGLDVLVIEPSSHIGGLTSGGLGQTDIGNKYAVVGLSRDFYRRVGKHYGTFEQWKFEPHVASNVFDQYIQEANLDVRINHRLISVETNDKRISSITCNSGNGNLTIYANIFMDCTYEGDLMAKADVSYTVGRESNEKYNETYNGVQLLEGHQFPDDIDPYIVKGDPSSGLLWGISDEELAPQGTGDDKVQAYNFRICLTDSLENMIPITRPNNYDSTQYELLLRLIEARNNDNLYSYFIWSRMPNRKTDINNRGGFSTDMIGMNWDYPEAGYEEREEVFNDHLAYTKGLLYFWGHDPRVPENARNEMQKWGYPKDEYTDNNHFTPQLYVREARRMIGSHVMTEHHCVGDEVVSDPIALAAYTMDSHNCQRLVVDGMVKNEGNVEIGGFPPYPISYRSLIPKQEECENLLVPVCLSASHIAFGSIRMEPVFMVLGQVAAIAAWKAAEKNIAVQDVGYKNISEMMDNNPLLDGTPPDVLVDNDDATKMEVIGTWDTLSRWMGQYKHDYLMSENIESSQGAAIFTAGVELSATYDLYYHVPRGNWREEDKYSENVTIEVNLNGRQKEIPVNLNANRHSWVQLGTFDISGGDKVNVKVNTYSDAPGMVVADAILMVPAK